MNERPAVTLRFDDRIAGQQLVGLGDGLAVEIQIVRELAYRRQRVTGLQDAGRDRRLDLFDVLLELRQRVVDIDGDFHHARASMYQLSQWYNWFIGLATPELRAVRITTSRTSRGELRLVPVHAPMRHGQIRYHELMKFLRTSSDVFCL